MKRYVVLFFVAVVFATCVFIGCSGDGGSGGGGSGSPIVGTWEGTYNEYNDGFAIVVRYVWEFNSNKTGTLWIYENDKLVKVESFTWNNNTSGMIYVIYEESGWDEFPYNGGDTFRFDVMVFTRI